MKYWPAWITNTILITCVTSALIIGYAATRPTFKVCVAACVATRGDVSLGRCQAGCFLR